MSACGNTGVLKKGSLLCGWKLLIFTASPSPLLECKILLVATLRGTVQDCECFGGEGEDRAWDHLDCSAKILRFRNRRESVILLLCFFLI